MKVQLLIPAAGMGLRLGVDRPKALAKLAGVPLLIRTLRRFIPLGLIDNAVIAVPPNQRGAFQKCLSIEFPCICFFTVDGGAERQDSVANGLEALRPSTELVVIHDAARPFVTQKAIFLSIAAARAFGAATVAVPAIDTILVADEQGFLASTPDRANLWACQTPQTFRVEVIRDAHVAAAQAGFQATDDASLVRWRGGQVRIVMGSPRNRKITTPEDLAYAEHLIRNKLVN